MTGLQRHAFHRKIHFQVQFAAQKSYFTSAGGIKELFIISMSAVRELRK